MDLITPSEKEFEGPFVFSKRSFIELDEVIKSIDLFMRQKLEEQIISKVDEYRKDPFYSQKSEKELRERSAPTKDYNYLSVFAFSKDGLRIDVDNVSDYLKEDLVKKMELKTIGVIARRGSYSFTLHIRHSIEKSIDYSISGFSESEKKK